jgi:hypothetical protein
MIASRTDPGFRFVLDLASEYFTAQLRRLDVFDATKKTRETISSGLVFVNRRCKTTLTQPAPLPTIATAANDT